MTTYLETRGSRSIATPALARLVAAKFIAGKTLAETIAVADAKTGAKTINLVSPIYWKMIADGLGPIEPTRSEVRAARRAGNRREVVALRSGLSVAEVAKLETSRGAKAVYVGRGTRRHLA